ncbi:hypothetical protein [Streptomyces orinoci]|uniref:Uncharacterized protein n=1 Tax=Streptomyces orinoci TaxID=67339 RepID=A0ABV3K5X2_STRON|nr:hypothetical protein [Streptomyces orinoci]
MTATLETSVPAAPSATAPAQTALVERRRAGEVLPRVPVGSLELTREQVAAGLFAQRDSLPDLPRIPTDLELLAAVERALAAYGLVGLEEPLQELDALPLGAREAGTAWAQAYRLCREHWYEDALCEPMAQSELAAALFASDLTVSRSALAYGRTALISGHVAEGVARLGIQAVLDLGQDMASEFGAPWRIRPVSQWRPEYLAVMPDRRRRKFCWDVAVNYSWFVPVPLVVWFDQGGCALGATPPQCPYALAVMDHIRGKHGSRG